MLLLKHFHWLWLLAVCGTSDYQVNVLAGKVFQWFLRADIMISFKMAGVVQVFIASFGRICEHITHCGLGWSFNMTHILHIIPSYGNSSFFSSPELHFMYTQIVRMSIRNTQCCPTPYVRLFSLLEIYLCVQSMYLIH